MKVLHQSIVVELVPPQKFLNVLVFIEQLLVFLFDFLVFNSELALSLLVKIYVVLLELVFDLSP